MKRFLIAAILLAFFITAASIAEAGHRRRPARRALCGAKALGGKVLSIRPGKAAKNLAGGVLARRPKLLRRRR